MSISPITSREYVYSTDDFASRSSEEPPKKILKKERKEYSISTIQDAQQSFDIRPSFFSDVDPALRLKLDPPISKTESINASEVYLMKKFFEAMAKQRDFKGINISLSNQSIQKSQAANEEIRKDFFKKVDELIAQKQKSKTSGWVLAIAGAGTLALSVGAAFATGGLSVVLTVVNGIVTISSGGLTVYKGYLDYDNKKITGHLEMKKHEREMNGRQIEIKMDEMQQFLEEILENVRKASELETNRYQAAMMINS